ncbi:hypothetical protein J3F84DRAFT_378431 [Trichoderma pleuroticola]
MNEITNNFNSNWLPLCRRFIESPPRDFIKRVDEHRKLSESVMEQVILKIDDVDIQGDGELRQRRKELVRQFSDVLRQLDDVPGVNSI